MQRNIWEEAPSSLNGYRPVVRLSAGGSGGPSELSLKAKSRISSGGRYEADILIIDTSSCQGASIRKQWGQARWEPERFYQIMSVPSLQVVAQSYFIFRSTALVDKSSKAIARGCALAFALTSFDHSCS